MQNTRKLVAYAHTLGGCPESEWERAEDHLRLVARLASEFASVFGASGPARIAGLWHDIGKYSQEFQQYLRGANGRDAHIEQVLGRVDHSTAGAQLAAKRFHGPVGRFLAYVIAGHHAGLPDADSESDGSLARRLAKHVPTLVNVPEELLDQPEPSFSPLVFAEEDRERAFQAAVFCRMLFSCLVDADFLATEQFMSHDRALIRPKTEMKMEVLERSVLRNIDRISASARTLPVNEHRQRILVDCLAAAEQKPGLLSLTVPTGGGKTLASLAMALKHARINGLRRVIYAIPFTSIIEQNADVFRHALSECGDNVVLEHHSNLDPEHETQTSRLAAENWDAPVVVTTNVQFFESLFAARTSRCRKLHRIVRSVIVLDEVQTLPVELLAPCLAILRELCRNYGCTVVLCSATQPALTSRGDFPIGLEGVREVVSDPPALFTAMKRAKIETVGTLSDDQLVERLARQRQVLCVVSTRSHAADIYTRVQGQSEGPCIHLSAQMCPEHRSQVIAHVRHLLKNNQPCTVVSTQLIEAGVDIDFPVVYRAIAGLDSIAQAAGRCNREGRVACGQVFVFSPERALPPGFLRQSAETTSELINQYDDLLGLDAVEAYFRLHFWKKQSEWDKHDVLGCFKAGGRSLDFREAAERFRFIRDESKPIIVPWGERGQQLVKRLGGPYPPTREIARLTQRFIVTIPERLWKPLIGNVVDVRHERYPVLVRASLYNDDVGLQLDATDHYEPEELFCG